MGKRKESQQTMTSEEAWRILNNPHIGQNDDCLYRAGRVIFYSTPPEERKNLCCLVETKKGPAEVIFPESMVVQTKRGPMVIIPKKR